MSTIIRADLHVHTCLSPCGDLQMTPRKIVAKALHHNIDVIAISDHNTAVNIPAVLRAAHGTPLIVLPGMEVCTREEIHVVALFDNVESAFELQQYVYERLEGENDEQTFGMQVVADENDEVVGFNSKLLIGAADISIEQAINIIHSLNGLAFASHIDRQSYSVISQLGFVPITTHFDGLEISSNLTVAEARKRFPEYSNYTFVQNSDAHFLKDFGNVFSKFLIEEISFAEIVKAFRNEKGRKIIQ
ncbi:MAG: PHP domain-containing protein [Ignavibacteriales bacterium]|nr:PHP domain-containing protein [Ignavibacteriales bacterium]